MNRSLLAVAAGFLALGLAAGWSGRHTRETLQQIEVHVAQANQQRLEIGKLNAGFTSTEGRPRAEDSVVASADGVAPWMVSGTPSLAGAAIGQAAFRRVVWRPTSWGAEAGLEIFDNAQTMAAGHFDLALVMVFGLPLVILLAPRHDAVLLVLGPAVSLAGILLTGAPLDRPDTWLRTAAWLALTGLYGACWWMVRRREPAFWQAAVVYVTLVVLLPGLASLLAELVLPPPSRLEIAAQKQVALRPVMAKTSRELAPFYETHPEFAEGGRTPADYDRIRLAAEAERQAALASVTQPAAGRVAFHRIAAQLLGMSSPAAIFHLALLETAGTGVSRQDSFEQSALDFGRKWSAELKARIGRGHPMRPADLDSLPVFQYQEQPVMDWLISFGVGAVSLIAWLGVVQLFRKKAA
ncbi:MAG: DUF3526 domain-containing protein [Bryobacteraceae bacterium]|nr:DUF3526 domain-containing protein [Bryobacteraceae bacterium]